MRLSQALLVSLWLCAGTAYGVETRVALIIGNSNYSDRTLYLENSINDARSMDRALRGAGFTTVVKLNANRLDFYDAVRAFKAAISQDPHAVGLFYYAGHGVQAEGTNYLIPVDAAVEAEGDLEAKAYDVGRVLKAMEGAQNEMNIVILDACRSNPLRKTRSAERGLARMEAPSGTFIAYAAAPGQSASDGVGSSNGVFTREFINAMSAGEPLEIMFKSVIAGVKRDTLGHQTPWSESSIQGTFYFSPPRPAPTPILPPPAQPSAASLQAAPSVPPPPGQGTVICILPDKTGRLVQSREDCRTLRGLVYQ